MRKIKKKILYIIFIFFIIFSYIYFKKYAYFKSTSDVPFCNFRDFNTRSCYIYFYVENKEIVYPVVYENSLLYFNILPKKNKLLTLIYPYWINEKLDKNSNIHLDDTLFLKLKSNIVKKELINTYKNVDILNDTNLVRNSQLISDLPQDVRNALIFILLNKGINCCPNCNSGFINIIYNHAQK